MNVVLNSEECWLWSDPVMYEALITIELSKIVAGNFLLTTSKMHVLLRISEIEITTAS